MAQHFQGIRTSIARKPYIFCDFQGVGGGGGGAPYPCLPSGPAPVFSHVGTFSSVEPVLHI